MDPIHEDHDFCQLTTAVPCAHYPACSGECLTNTRGSQGDNTLARPISKSTFDPRVPYPAANLANMNDPYYGNPSFGATMVSPFAPSMSDLWPSSIGTEGIHTQIAIPEYTTGGPIEYIPPYPYMAYTLGTLDQDGQRDWIPSDSTPAPAFDTASQNWRIDPSTANSWVSAPGYPPVTASFMDETPTMPWTGHSGYNMEAPAQYPWPSSHGIDTSTPAYEASHADLLMQPISNTSSRVVPFRDGLSATERCGHPSSGLGFSSPSLRAIDHFDSGPLQSLHTSKLLVPLGYSHVDHGSVEHHSLGSLTFGNPSTALTNAGPDRLAMPGFNEIPGKKR